MIPAPQGVRPIEPITNSKGETKEQLTAPETLQPIEKKGSGQKEKERLIDKIDFRKEESKNCVGWNKMGCSSESIKKVQSCMNVGVSGIFDSILRDVLASYPTTYAYKDGFNDTDVDKICLAKQTADRIALLDKEKNAKMQMKKQEMDAFLKQYPQQTTKATKTDQF